MTAHQLVKDISNEVQYAIKVCLSSLNAIAAPLMGGKRLAYRHGTVAVAMSMSGPVTATASPGAMTTPPFGPF
jgi:hypothetical protein